jgi:hypothetical protein
MYKINMDYEVIKLKENEPNVFSIYKYNDYALGDKKNDHSWWFDFMIYRRQQTINDILNG